MSDQTFLQGTGYAPDGASQLMMWVAVVGIISDAVLRHDLLRGYWLSFLTGLLYLVFIGVIGVGMPGPMPSGGPLIGLILGPVAQVVYAIVLIGSTYVALRERRKISDVHARNGDVTAETP